MATAADVQEVRTEVRELVVVIPVQVETNSQTCECPECWAVTSVANLLQNEIIQCPDCGTDLEYRDGRLDLAPEEEEDWGE